MSSFDFDLFVIGAGSGGVRASRLSAGFGARVAVAEASYDVPRGFPFTSYLRVIGSEGKLVGFGGGIWRKEWLLEHEKRFQ